MRNMGRSGLMKDKTRLKVYFSFYRTCTCCISSMRGRMIAVRGKKSWFNLVFYRLRISDLGGVQARRYGSCRAHVYPIYRGDVSIICSKLLILLILLFCTSNPHQLLCCYASSSSVKYDAI